jgi:hypothetical protein
MRYQITGAGWRVGQYLIPSGTVINTRATDRWSLFARGRTPPINSTPLDQEAWEAQLAAYGAEHRHLLGGGWQ